MDEQITGGYSEPCGQCAAVDWGVSDEGQFFCKSCHNVIEKIREVEDVTSLHHKHGRISIVRKPKKKKHDSEREWLVCEGFQFILKHQAKALVSLGVCMKFETEVLWNFWKRYLQNTRQAFTENPVSTARFEVFMKSQSGSESDTQSHQSCYSEASSDTEMSVSGISVDGRSAVSSESLHSIPQKGRRGRVSNLMSMPRTLAMCYLALLWVREAITLTDLLRMVAEGHIPYLHLHETFPAEMRMFGKDVQIFRVLFFPSYAFIKKEALVLAKIMKLPSFPTISQDCLFHPVPLTVRYLLEANLPDALHVWVQKVITGAGMDSDSFLTFDPTDKKPHLLSYDVQAVAVIIVAMKLLFKLDDHVEWKLSHDAAKKKNNKVFSLERWFNIVQPVLEQARLKEEQEEARRQWNFANPFITNLKRKSLVLKKRRVTDHLQQRFQKFADPAPEQSTSTTNSHTSFRFSWGEEEGSDGPSMFNQNLDCTVKAKAVNGLANQRYWHPELRICPENKCVSHFSKFEPSLPRMFVWVLDLFSFILGVLQSDVYEEVLNVERRFLKKNYRLDSRLTSSHLKKKKGPIL
uniref:TATA box-binding protein-associated factor RNA polymerase I subunit B n=1 Tax=Danio rerio TaxID=7955 RepID=TAF1B_DANRE|nr:RecName: Full=TATA box-binding protein-associated factor RNA polymerase I subunit B; AltName: Full=RNA polymerase I-specific TBP-associated factor 63 kDa; Short=TAFI63; AltName: Full=TATA box-binding protein-associated factor 1B; Short=TBP-associated factor 1B [Danio rerio]